MINEIILSSLLLFIAFLLLIIYRSSMGKAVYILRIDTANHRPSIMDRLKLAWEVGVFGPRRFRVTFLTGADDYFEPEYYAGAFNKLLGRTHGFLKTPRMGSTRWVWRRRRNSLIEIGKITEPIGDRSYEEVFERKYVVYEGSSFIVDISSDEIGWPLGFYFGGKFPAPVPVYVIIERLP